MVARSSNVATYTGGPVREKANIDALRATVPDDPIRLPPGHLACEGCGIAHDGPVVASVPLGRLAVNYTRCPDCQALHDQASALAEGLAYRRTVDTLYALSIVGIAAPKDPAPLVPWMHLVGSAVPWLDPAAPTEGWCSPHPWAHVRLSQRAQIKEAYLLGMRNRVRLSAEPLDLAPPWGGACLFCGVGSLPMAPIEVVRRGGRESAAHKVWRRVLVQPSALGGRGADLVDGFLCPPCAEVADSTGAIGVRARARAFEAHVRRTRPAEAGRVRSFFDDHDQITLPGWAALGTLRPNAEPWAHVVIPDPEDS